MDGIYGDKKGNSQKTIDGGKYWHVRKNGKWFYAYGDWRNPDKVYPNYSEHYEMLYDDNVQKNLFKRVDLEDATLSISKDKTLFLLNPDNKKYIDHLFEMMTFLDRERVTLRKPLDKAILLTLNQLSEWVI